MPSDSNSYESLFAEWVKRRENGEAEDFASLLEGNPVCAEKLRELHSAWQLVSGAMKSEARRLQSASRVIATPTVLGHYTKLELLGRGGQGEVWLAEDMRLRRKVALKILRETEPARLRRFEREAGITSRLDHPGICPVYEWGEEGGVYYIAMRYVEGKSLAKLLVERVPLPGAANKSRRSSHSSSSVPTEQREIQQLVRILAGAARALHTAHEAGVVHRDVKPANILVTRDNEPVVVDFGFAQDSDGDWSELTRSAEFLGTPAYMSPEQIQGTREGQIDRRTDVWSLGATLYESLAGVRPFAGATWQATFRAIAATEPTRLATLNPALDRDLEVIVETALAKERERRYATAAAFANDLDAWLEGRPISARAISNFGRLTRWARREPALAILLGVLAVALPTLGALASYVSLTREDVRAGERLISDQKKEDSLLAAYAYLSGGKNEMALPILEELTRSFPTSTDAAFGKFWGLYHVDRPQAEAYFSSEFPEVAEGSFLQDYRRRLLGGELESPHESSALDLLPPPGDAIEHFVAAWLATEAWYALEGNERIYRDVPVGHREWLERAREHLECALLMSPSPRLLHIHMYADVLGKLRASPRVLEALYTCMRQRWPATDWGPKSVAQALCTTRPEITVQIVKDLGERGFDVDDVQTSLGAAYANLKDFDAAEQAFRKVIEVDPNSSSGYYNLGALLLQRYDFEAVVAANREAVRLSPGAPTPLSNLGLGLLHQGVFDEALRASQAAFDYDSTQLYALHQIARCLCWRGDLEGAIAQARRAVELQGSDPVWKVDSAGLLNQLLALQADAKLLESWLVAGSFEPDPAEAARLAWSACLMGRFEESAGLFADLYGSEAELFSQGFGEVAFHAAAASGYAATVAPEGASIWPELALEWFDVAITALERVAQSSEAVQLQAHEHVRYCRRDPEYAALREPRWWSVMNAEQVQVLKQHLGRLNDLCDGPLAAICARDSAKHVLHSGL